MQRSLSYADAVRVLGGQDNKTVDALDRLTGGLLLIASAAGSGLALSLFDGKAELARLGGDLIARLDQRVSGVGRFDRSERLAAANAIIVVTAYFEVLAGIELPFDLKELSLSRTDEVRLAGGAPGSSRLQALATELLRVDVPMPGPQSPHEETVESLRCFYRQLSSALLRFISGLSVWDRLDETRRARLHEVLDGLVPDRAVRRYEESLRRLAVDCPEVAFWTSLINHQATREQLRSLDRSLAGLEHLLSLLVGGRMPDQRRVALSRAHRAALARPILTSGEVPDGLRIPTLEDGYINPDFRAADVAPTDRVADESWWEKRPLRQDLQEFLLGHLTSPQATLAPLLVLGQPGSGKSLLTRLLAARLPADAFLAVRVVLRDVPADSDVQTQIEHGVRAATGEHLSWPDLARTAGDALPVVLLDGFDELLQATGVSQSDYLERVATLQRREADQGRPVAVLVTSRTAVADRARPTAGMVAVRLEPFGEVHVRRWLESWNAANEPFFAARGLRGLAGATVLRHADLASQPLLLLMLALYDADENRLQREDAGLSRAELYERLLTQFAEREVRKAGAALPEASFAREVESELLRLSVVAFAMFNRSRQWTTEAEFDADLSALLDDWRRTSNASGLRAPLTAAAIVIGRFFFVHEAQAIQDNAELRTFEFLHSTFGEYLIARLVAQELRHLVHTAELDLARTRHSPADDAFLHALLSFAPLTIRDTAVSFLRQLLETEISQRSRLLLRDVLLALFRDALQSRRDTRYADYAPALLAVPTRHASWSANLLLLAVLAGGELTGSELFAGAEDVKSEWHRMALLWRSQLQQGWTALIHTLDLAREWRDERRELRLRLAPDTANPAVDPYWTYDYAPASERRGTTSPEGGPTSGWAWQFRDNEGIRRQSRFVCGHDEDVVAHALEPLAADLGSAIVTFGGYWSNRCVSAAHALIRLWLTAGQDAEPAELQRAYDTCLQIALYGFAPHNEEKERYAKLVLRQLRTDLPRLQPTWVAQTVDHINRAKRDGPLIRRLTHDLVPELMAYKDSNSSTAHG